MTNTLSRIFIVALAVVYLGLAVAIALAIKLTVYLESLLGDISFNATGRDIYFQDEDSCFVPQSLDLSSQADVFLEEAVDFTGLAIKFAFEPEPAVDAAKVDGLDLKLATKPDQLLQTDLPD